MKLHWTGKALTDLDRLHEFLATINRGAAARTIRAIVAAPNILSANPRIGERIDEFLPREVRRILVREYEMRYEIKNSEIYILRIWHTKERR